MVSTRHGEGRAETNDDVKQHAPASRTAAVKRTTQQAGARRRAQGRHQEQEQLDGSSEGLSSGEEGLSDEEGPLVDQDSPEAASAGELEEEEDADEAAATGGRSARAGRSLRDTIKKPPPSNVIQTFTRQPTPPKHLSRSERRQQQRDRERQQRQQEAELQELAAQRQELQQALRAAAGGYHLTRHQTRLLKQWSEDAPGVDPDLVAAAAAGNEEAAAALAAAAAEAAVDGLQSSEGDDEEGGGSEDEEGEEAGSSEEADQEADGDSGDADDGEQADQEQGDGEEVAGDDEAAGGPPTAAEAAGRASNRRTRQQSQPAVAAGAARGLKGELLRLKQAAAEAKASERRRRQREAMRQAARQQRLLAEQRGLGGSRRSSLEDVVLEYSSAEEGLLQGSSSQEEAGRGHTRRAGRHLRKRRRAAWPQGSEDDDGDAGEEDEDAGGGGGRRKYKLRSRDNRVNVELMHTEQPRQTARPKPKSGDQQRPQIKTSRPRRRGGFSELSSDDPGDEGAFLSGHWSRLLATAAGPAGPFYASAGLPPTPAAAAVAAAATAAAANGMLSPRASLDRRGSAFLDAAVAPGTASRVVGSGWGHWGAAGGAGEAGGAGGSGGGGAAAAAAGGTAAEKRGAGLGQELITPLQVDPSIDFDQIGGLDQYLSALKEMVFLPLLYPEIFDKFGVTPPRGVLFHGPPGTGKTLVARALAAQASKAAGQKVSFYMRKGADLLSKWVGEAEKQLRLLFEEASKHQPAIIFFDEIDGLAPVRTSKQDQVHNSIVSTLLALMDGLDSRGRVVLIGATNRPDALDPALRRPGRFDRELLFPMPDLAARRSILAIHSRHWQPQPPPKLLDDLAQQTGGYCGADLRALCAEASLAALRRVYPQIYASDVKLLIDPSAVHVTQQDFISAMKDLTPAAHRATASHAKALNPVIQPCLAQPLSAALSQVRQIFPPAAACMAQSAAAGSSSSKCHGQPHGLAKMGAVGVVNGSGSGSSRQVLQMARPRLLLVGPQGSGQQQLGAAVLAALEGLPVHCIGLTSLLANVAARCVEEALVSAFTEARRSAPAIIYWPQAHLWWAAAGSGLRCALVALLDDLPADLPLLLLATAELPATDADAAAAGTAGSSRRLLPGPSSTAAAAAAGRASTAASGQEQPGECLEELGLDPTLAALFPPLGCLSDLQGLLLRKTAQQDADLPQGQQNPQAGMADPQQQQQLEQHCSQVEAAAGHGRGVLGWVLLQPPGPLERRKMFQGILDAAAAPPVPEDSGQGQQPPVPLPPAPDAAAAAEAQRKAAEAAAARVAYEEDQAVLRSLRMILRGIVQRALTLKRYRLFAEPPMLDDEEGIHALQCLSCPMDLLTMLYKVDHQEYITPAAFLADAHLIVRCAEELYGHPEEAAGTGAGFASAAAQHAGTSAAAAAAAGAAAGAGEGAVGDDAEAGAADAAAGAAGPDHVEAGNDPGQQAEDTGPAAAARAAAAAAGPQVQQVHPLPAVRVAVCKEISRATELKDGLEQQVYQLVPPDLAQACEAIAAKGGPAAPPPGMLLPQQLLAAKLPSLAAARGTAADAAAAGKPTRTTARLTGRKLDRRLLHADPEALMRAHKQSKAKTAAQQAAAAAEAAAEDLTQQPPSQQQEQKQEEQTQQADVDVEMAEAANDAVHAVAAAAATTSAAADQDAAAAAMVTAADAEPQQQEQQQQQPTEEESPAALQPVTNGVSRKRRAPSAGDSADGDAGRVAKAARHSVGVEQQVFGSAAGNSSDDVPTQQQQQQQQHGTGGESGQQQLEVGPQLLQPHNKQQQDSLPHGPEPQQAAQQLSDGGALLPLQPLQEPAAPAAAAADLAAAGQLLDRIVQATAGMQLSALELLHARLSRVVAANAHQEDRSILLQQLAHIITRLEQAAQ